MNRAIISLLLIVLSRQSNAQETSLELHYIVTSGPFPLGNTSLIFYESPPNKYRIRQDKDISVPGVYTDQSVSMIEGNIIKDTLQPVEFEQRRRGGRSIRTTTIQWTEEKPTVTIEPPLRGVNVPTEAMLNSKDPISTMRPLPDKVI